MDLDNSWYGSDLAVDVFEILRSQETSLPQIGSIRVIEGRELMVKWIIKLANSVYVGQQIAVLDNCTIHLAVQLLDAYISKSEASESRCLVAAAALIVAAKFEEESKVNACVIRQVIAWLPEWAAPRIWYVEMDILRAANWRLLIPTSVAFVPYFIAATDARGSDAFQAPSQCTRSRKKRRSSQTASEYWYLPELYFQNSIRRKMHPWRCQYFESLVYRLCGYSLLSSVYRRFKPSEIAASAVAAARFCINAAPTWPSSIADLTNYTLLQLHSCIHFLLHDFDCDRRHDANLFSQLIHRGDFATSWLIGTRSVCYPIMPATTSPEPSQSTGASMSPITPTSQSVASLNALQQQPPFQLSTVHIPTIIVFLGPTGERVHVVCSVPTACVTGVALVGSRLLVRSTNGTDSNAVSGVKRLKLNPNV